MKAPSPTGGAAFPTTVDTLEFGSPGMHLRDYFACHALAGLLGCSDDVLSPRDAAQMAYSYADQLLMERDRAFYRPEDLP